MNAVLRSVIVVLGVGLAAVAWAARGSLMQQHDHAQAEALPADTEAATPCRQGAFVQASEIINSITDVALTFPASTPEKTRKALDTVLFTALEQAVSEVHCVAGALQHGYGRAYADVVRRGADLARMRDLPKKVVQQARAAAAALERNEPLQPGEIERTASGGTR